MEKAWRHGLPTCTGESIVGPIGRNRRGESGSRKATEGNDLTPRFYPRPYLSADKQTFTTCLWSGNCGAGRQNRSARGREGSHPDLGRGLSGLFVRVPAGAQPARCIGRAVCRDNAEEVNWVLDLDVKSFFDKVEHDWMIQFVEHRIA